MPSWTAAALATHLDVARRLALVPLFVASARRHGVPLPVLMGLSSRESGMGALIERAAWRGDYGHGRGVMQIDDRAHPAFVAAHRDDDHAANIDYGAAYLARQARTFGGYNRAALAAYNAGPGAVQQALRSGRDPDSVTTGRDFGADVLARADALGGLLGDVAAPIAGGMAAVALVAAAAFFAYRHFSRSRHA